jgi:hypothetical protein
MTPTTEQLESLHALYCRLTGFDRPLTMQLRYKWERWCYEGHTAAELELVLKYLMRQVYTVRCRQKECLLPRNVIEDTEQFADNLLVAKAQARVPRRDDPKAKVLRVAAIKDSLTAETMARSAADILAGKTALDDFHRMGKEL